MDLTRPEVARIEPGCLVFHLGQDMDGPPCLVLARGRASCLLVDPHGALKTLWLLNVLFRLGSRP